MDNYCIRSDIHVLEMMIKAYEERGGGYSQKAAMRTAISIMKAFVNVQTTEKDNVPVDICEYPDDSE